jgi:predicted transcriptional regulator
VNFSDLHALLIATLRRRLRNGEFTERGLARVTGISQPHVHHVLKGTRYLSTGAADHVLATMHIDLLDLTR